MNTILDAIKLYPQDFIDTLKVRAETTPNSTYLKTSFPWRWNLSITYYLDYKDLQAKITNRYLGNNNINSVKEKQYEYLIYGGFPFLQREEYEVRFEYVLPSKVSGNSAIIKYENTF